MHNICDVFRLETIKRLASNNTHIYTAHNSVSVSERSESSHSALELLICTLFYTSPPPTQFRHLYASCVGHAHHRRCRIHRRLLWLSAVSVVWAGVIADAFAWPVGSVVQSEPNSNKILYVGIKTNFVRKFPRTSSFGDEHHFACFLTMTRHERNVRN